MPIRLMKATTPPFPHREGGEDERENRGNMAKAEHIISQLQKGPFGQAGEILAELGVRKIRLLTNNPRKIIGLEGYGLEILERVPIQMPATRNNIQYLRAKQQKLGHLLENL